jgi:hypothetical protein
VALCADGAGVAEHAFLGIVAVLPLGDERNAGRALADRAEPADTVEAGIVAAGDVATALYSYAGLTRMFPAMPACGTIPTRKRPWVSHTCVKPMALDDEELQVSISMKVEHRLGSG